MNGWNELLTGLLALDDERIQGQRDTERVAMQINALAKRSIPVERKRRKGRILKELKKNMRGWPSPYYRYTRTAIRSAINEIRVEDWGVA